MYSPWCKCLRPEASVMHGLFVFRTLEQLWLRVNTTHSERILNFAEQRVNEIRDQISMINSGDF